jgi:P2X purinoceptor 4
MAAGVISRVFGVFFEYDTPRIVHIRSKKVGVINRFLQLCIIGYVIG